VANRMARRLLTKPHRPNRIVNYPL
jgi:hypothetical protein